MGRPEIAITASDVEKGPSPSGNHAGHEYEVQRSEYLDKVVEPKLQHRPWLESLQRFMDPTAKGFAVDQRHRMTHFDIKVIQIPMSGDLSSNSVIDCKTPEAFLEAVNDDKNCSGTIVVVKDLSRAMIDVLGTQYELEPEFFASHLEGTELYGMGYRAPPGSRTTARAPILLPDYIRQAPFYTAEFRRPYHIEGGAGKIFELRSSLTSLPRGVEFLKEDLPAVFVFEKISVYRKKDSKVGIILTDQLLSQDPPASYMLNPITALFFSSLPTPINDATRTHQVSSRHELISYIQHLPPSSCLALFASDNSPLFLIPVLKIVEGCGAQFLRHVRTIMILITNRHCDETFPDSIPFFLHISRELHRHIHDHQKILRYALRVAALRGGDDIAEQRMDFEFLIEDIEAALKSLKEDVRYLVAAAQIQEGKFVGWVSKFAALFLPVSLLATILGISDPGYTRWAILGALSIPFVVVSIYLMFFWRPKVLESSSF